MVSRSTAPNGPFYDLEGKPILGGGGSELMVGNYPIAGPGGPNIYKDGDEYIIVYHYYDLGDNGNPRLAINNIAWTQDGWPYVY
jgi:arabinan endo-1,5-alpha-L-arabinosidase